MKRSTRSAASLALLAAGSALALGACAEPSSGPLTSERPSLARDPGTGSGTITIIRGGTGEGTITSSPAGIDCTIGPEGATGTCEATFPSGTRVRLKAVAADNSKFEGWAPVRSCMKPNIRIEDGGLYECQPVFTLEQPSSFLLQAVQEGSGQITSSPAGIDCTADADAGTVSGQCAATYPAGSIVTLTATPSAGWLFAGWSGDDADCNDGEVTMTSAKRCVATFVRA